MAAMKLNKESTKEDPNLVQSMEPTRDVACLCECARQLTSAFRSLLSVEWWRWVFGCVCRWARPVLSHRVGVDVRRATALHVRTLVQNDPVAATRHQHRRPRRSQSMMPTELQTINTNLQANLSTSDVINDIQDCFNCYFFFNTLFYLLSGRIPKKEFHSWISLLISLASNRCLSSLWKVQLSFNSTHLQVGSAGVVWNLVDDWQSFDLRAWILCKWW